MRAIILCLVGALAIAGCSAKGKARFENLSGKICAQVRELESEVALGTVLVPSATAKMALGLTYQELLVQCAIRDQIFAPEPVTRTASTIIHREVH